jgi:DNA-binding transcriptional LysR family regulator
MQLNGTEAVKKAVEANLGVAFVSCYAIECELRAGTLVRLAVDGLQIEREYVLLHRARKYLTPATTELQRFIREYTSQYLEGSRHP